MLGLIISVSNRTAVKIYQYKTDVFNHGLLPQIDVFWPGSDYFAKNSIQYYDRIACRQTSESGCHESSFSVDSFLQDTPIEKLSTPEMWISPHVQSSLCFRIRFDVYFNTISRFSYDLLYYFLLLFRILVS